MADDLLDYATEFRFPVFPEGHPDWDLEHEAVRVEWRGDGRWAVILRGSWCIDAEGNTEYESIPSERSDEFKATFRFGRDEAIRVAREVGVPQERARWEKLIVGRTAREGVRRGSGR
jgi:hypothetical protein